MFKHSGKDAPAPVEKVSIIASGMVVNGDLDAEGDIRIDGEVRGNVYSKAKVVVIPSGKVYGDIIAANADIHGLVEGNIQVGDTLNLRSKCNIKGNLTTQRLQMESSAFFNGYCSMKAAEKIKEEKPEVVFHEN